MPWQSSCGGESVWAMEEPWRVRGEGQPGATLQAPKLGLLEASSNGAPSDGAQAGAGRPLKPAHEPQLTPSGQTCQTSCTARRRWGRWGSFTHVGRVSTCAATEHRPKATHGPLGAPHRSRQLRKGARARVHSLDLVHLVLDTHGDRVDRQCPGTEGGERARPRHLDCLSRVGGGHHSTAVGNAGPPNLKVPACLGANRF